MSPIGSETTALLLECQGLRLHTPHKDPRPWLLRDRSGLVRCSDEMASNIVPGREET
jgi:hypothetical protein